MATPASPTFAYSTETLQSLAQHVLHLAKALGASDCSTEFSDGHGLSVSVRKGAVETIEHNRDKGMGVTIYLPAEAGQQGYRRGHASSSDFSLDALKATVQAAYDIARYTAVDDCAGLPEPESLQNSPHDLGLYTPWNIDATTAIQIAQTTEAAAFATSKQIRNSDGASVHAQHGHFILANSRGFMGGYPYSRHSIACAPIAQSGRNIMQRDDWYSSQRDPAKLAAPAAIGRYAAERALARLHARRLSTRRVPVLFEAPLAAGLLGALTQALSGGALYRQSSFLLNSLGQQVLAPHLQVWDDPTLQGGMGSASFDDEGCRTARRQIIKDGVVAGYFLSTYSGRKLGLPTTGNAGGAHNLSLTSTQTIPNDDLPAMLRKLGTGLFVTELMGQGVNYVTGDYSRGAFGYWVENGVIQYPVEEITIASNLKTMLRDIVAVGADYLTRGTKTTGSILIESMQVAGN
ncbi:metalloprotease PmbA [Parvibium lacunae]